MSPIERRTTARCPFAHATLGHRSLWANMTGSLDKLLIIHQSQGLREACSFVSVGRCRFSREGASSVTSVGGGAVRFQNEYRLRR